MIESNEVIFRSYTRALRARGRSEATVGQYREAIADLDRCLDTDLLLAAKVDVQRYLAQRLGEVKTTTVGIRFRALRAFFNWAVSEEEIETSPMRGLKEPCGKDEPPGVLDDEDLRKLIKAAAGKDFRAIRDTAAIRLLCEPGSPRLGELAAIRLADVDMDHDLISVTGKTGTRLIPFGSKTGQALDRYLRARTRHPRHRESGLWLTVKGEMSPSGIAQMLARRAKLAGLPRVHPHQLRHTAASAWLASGGSEGDAMSLFGWRSPDMPRLYGRSAAITRAHQSARSKALGDRL